MLRLDSFLPYRLSIASNAVSERVASVYQLRFGLKIPEWRVLAVVAERGEATQAALADATQMDRMTISRAATALVDRGALQRSQAADRRTLALRLTAEGERLYAQITPLALSMEADLVAQLEPGERAQLMRLLRKLEDCAKS